MYLPTGQSSHGFTQPNLPLGQLMHSSFVLSSYLPRGHCGISHSPALIVPLTLVIFPTGQLSQAVESPFM
jgi:hypothetical protein